MATFLNRERTGAALGLTHREATPQLHGLHPVNHGAGVTNPVQHPVHPGANHEAAAGVVGHFGTDDAPRAAAPGARPQTARERFDKSYEDLRNRELNQDERNAARWRELSGAEIAGTAPIDLKTVPKPGELGYTTTVNGHMYRYEQVQEDPKHATQAKDLLGPAASQFHSRAFVTDRAKKDPKDPKEHTYHDVTVLNPNGTTSTLSQNDSGQVELPTSGFGFSTYNRNDVFLPGGKTRQKDQWGTPEAVSKIINIANDYGTLQAGQNDANGTLQPGRTIQYGDIATDDSKSPLIDTGKTRRHASHGTGDQVDIRYPSTTFDTNTFIRTGENWGANNFYYNPDLAGQAFFGANTHSAANAEHRNHLHMGFGLGGP